MNYKKLIGTIIAAIMIISSFTETFAAKYEYDELGRLISTSYDSDSV